MSREIVTALDDIVAPFSLDHAPVRGRIARFGAGALDPILRRHAYPRPVAMLLGEAITLAALVNALLKTDGRLTVQAEGDGPVSLLVAECGADIALRGYARFKDSAALAGAHRMAPSALLGEGRLALTLDLGPDMAPQQGVVTLEGETLAQCAQTYFRSSEQTETRIRLAVGESFVSGAAPIWRGGGVLLQAIGRDDARGDRVEDWSRASMLFETVRDDELIDPDLPADRLLYRLFHEEGVRMAKPAPAVDRCTCDEGRLTAVLQQFPQTELADLIEPDGMLHARCQFCAREYVIDPQKVCLP